MFHKRHSGGPHCLEHLANHIGLLALRAYSDQERDSSPKRTHGITARALHCAVFSCSSPLYDTDSKYKSSREVAAHMRKTSQTNLKGSLSLERPLRH